MESKQSCLPSSRKLMPFFREWMFILHVPAPFSSLPICSRHYTTPLPGIILACPFLDLKPEMQPSKFTVGLISVLSALFPKAPIIYQSNLTECVALPPAVANTPKEEFMLSLVYATAICLKCPQFACFVLHPLALLPWGPTSSPWRVYPSLIICPVPGIEALHEIP